MLEIVIFGAGCFWGVEAAFAQVPGVSATRAGYAGGTAANPTYQQVCTGATGHAEVVEVTFDPKKVTFDKLLELFWEIHDPTTLNRQGPDIGAQYRSVIFGTTSKQVEKARASKKALEASARFGRPIVTEIRDAPEFYPAEDYHQKYYLKHGVSCHIPPSFSKKAKADAPKPQKRGAFPVQRSEAEWRSLLSEEQYRIIRMKGTERAFTGAYWDHKGEGTYRCAACGAALFKSGAKYDSGTGWPSFYEAAESGIVAEERDESFVMARTEIHCSKCGAHLGHLFDDGPAPTGERYCVNSASLEFEDGEGGTTSSAGRR